MLRIHSCHALFIQENILCLDLFYWEWKQGLCLTNRCYRNWDYFLFWVSSSVSNTERVEKGDYILWRPFLNVRDSEELAMEILTEVYFFCHLITYTTYLRDKCKIGYRSRETVCKIKYEIIRVYFCLFVLENES